MTTYLLVTSASLTRFRIRDKHQTVQLMKNSAQVAFGYCALLTAVVLLGLTHTTTTAAANMSNSSSHAISDHRIVENDQDIDQHEHKVEQGAEAAFPDDGSDALAEPNTDLVETASKYEKFNILVAALKKAGLINAIRTAENFTIFAPTNAAFAVLTDGNAKRWLDAKNKDELKQLLSDHIVPQALNWKQLFGRKTVLQAISGKPLVVDGRDGVRVNGVKLVISDVKATNGLIHIVDQIIPPAKLSVPTT